MRVIILLFILVLAVFHLEDAQAETVGLQCFETNVMGHKVKDTADINLLHRMSSEKAIAFGKAFNKIYNLPHGNMYESKTHMLSVEILHDNIYTVHSFDRYDRNNNQYFECTGATL